MISKWERAAWEKKIISKWPRERVELQFKKEGIQTLHFVGADLLKTEKYWQVGRAYIKRSNCWFIFSVFTVVFTCGAVHRIPEYPELEETQNDH